jgi:hypothetical protein
VSLVRTPGGWLRLVTCAVLVAATAVANEIPGRDLASRLNISDAVVIGNVVSTHPITIGASEQRYAVVRVITQLHGTKRTDGTITVLYDGPISEHNPICCVSGSDYLLFLKRVPGPGFFESAAGPYGAYPISDGYVSGWREGQDARTPLLEVLDAVQEASSGNGLAVTAIQFGGGMDFSQDWTVRIAGRNLTLETAAGQKRRLRTLSPDQQPTLRRAIEASGFAELHDHYGCTACNDNPICRIVVSSEGVTKDVSLFKYEEGVAPTGPEAKEVRRFLTVWAAIKQAAGLAHRVDLCP